MENPDRKDPVHGPMAPSGGDLRFVEREVSVRREGISEMKKLRILQRWEWSYVDSKWVWYDVHLAKEENNSKDNAG